METFIDEIEQRIATLRTLHESMGEELARAKDVAEGAGRIGVERIDDLATQLKALKDDDDLDKRLAKFEKEVPQLLRRIVALEKRPIARARVSAPWCSRVLPRPPWRTSKPYPDRISTTMVQNRSGPVLSAPFRVS